MRQQQDSKEVHFVTSSVCRDRCLLKSSVVSLLSERDNKFHPLFTSGWSETCLPKHGALCQKDAGLTQHQLQHSVCFTDGCSCAHQPRRTVRCRRPEQFTTVTHTFPRRSNSSSPRCSTTPLWLSRFRALKIYEASTYLTLGPSRPLPHGGNNQVC